MPPSNNKRNSSGDAAAGSPKAKKAKTTPSLADDLICPITQELPIDPVNADDGQHYEREAIESHIKNNAGRELKSPITNEGMGPRLVPAHRIKSAIETAITLGHITGDLADKWKEKMKEKKEMDELVKKAEAGDVDAMFNSGLNYLYGDDGFPKDPKLAYKWFKKGDEKGDNDATAGLGELLLKKSGLPESSVSGVMYLGIAAAKGSNWAASTLGHALANETSGLSVNKVKAIYWLEQSLTLSGSMDDDGKDEVRQTLQELKAEMAGNN